MSSRRVLLAVILIAAALRVFGLDWDQDPGFHPDERRIAFALDELSFHPLQLNPHFFAYGSFPLYVQKIWIAIAGALYSGFDGFHGRIVAARVLSAVVGVAMVGCLAMLGSRVYDFRTGLLAALLLALCVLPIQHAHFITVDLYQAALALVVLERLVAFLQTRKQIQFLVAAAVAGLTLATKVSSAPLLGLLVLAPWLDRRADGPRRSFLGKFGLATLGIVVAAVFFAVGEPFALIDHQAFLHDVSEQGAMVRNPGTVPYTVQYLGTRPYLDDLRQVFTWGMGPFLGFTAALGSLLAFVRVMRGRRSEEILLLSFFLPYLLVTGYFPVKFMRYLLPLYPLWCLYAARLLDTAPLPSRMRRAVAALVVVGTGAYALAFVTIYTRPHVWVTASRWFYREFPAGSLVLTPHWEEGFPIRLEGFERDRYRYFEVPFFEPDDKRKTANLAATLASADALVFPSKRMYGAVTKAPDRYPQTTRFLELLFDEDLGYRLDRVFASRPSLPGVTLDDDDADESFSVYDHPKTLIFRNLEKLSATQIEIRLGSRVPSRPIGREQMLAADTTKPPSPEEKGSRWIESSWVAMVVWSIGLYLFAFFGRRLLAAVVPDLPDLAIAGLGPTAGYLIFSYASWLLAASAGVPFTRLTLAAIALCMVLAGVRLRPTPGGLGSFILYAAFAFFLAIRAANPEIYWGEKPMDFSFLNAIYRATTMPPAEPWMSGKIINYPYFGHFGIAAFGKLVGVSPAFAFNLGIATIAALCAAGAFGAGVLLSGRLRGGIMAALLVAFAGNLAGPLEYRARFRADFDYFWATSRVIRDTINEFPLWSFLFADLHAHVMALPLSVLLLAFIAYWFTAPGRSSASLLALSSLTFGAIATTSTWSVPIYGGVFLGAGALAAIVERRPFVRLSFPVLAIVLSQLWFLPYWIHFASPGLQWGWERQSAAIGGVMTIFGAFLLVLFAAFGRIASKRSLAPAFRIGWLVAVAIIAWFSTRGFFFSVAVTAILAALAENSPPARFAFALAAAATAMGGLADTFYLWDRMNTIFKSYLEMWVFFALASSLWLTRSRTGESPRRSLSWVASAGLAVVAGMSIFTAVTDVLATLRTVRVPGPRPTLDGTAYLTVHRPEEAKAIFWLNQNVSGSAVILEAQGPSYQEFSRISMNTGLPTVLGWDYHLSQRAQSWSEINERKVAIATLYSGTDRKAIDRLLAKYHVALVYVGDLERSTYPAEGLGKFEAWSDQFTLVYRNPKVEIFAVPANFHWDQTQPFIEAVSAPVVDRPPPSPTGELRQPRGAAVDRKGNIWVADFGNNRVQVFSPALAPLLAFGERGSGDGEFNDPCGIAMGPDGLIYVADTWNHRVEVFDEKGQLVRQWSGEFFGPRGIAVGSDGSVYVTDTGNGRIAKFSAGGELLARFGKKGSGPTEFDEPIGIAVSPEGKIYVADVHNRRIAVLATDGSLLAHWAVPGWKGDAYMEPYLAVLPDGGIVVSDPSGDRLLFYDREGRVTAEKPTSTGGNPSGVAIGPDKKIVVSELKANRLAVTSVP